MTESPGGDGRHQRPPQPDLPAPPAPRRGADWDAGWGPRPGAQAGSSPAGAPDAVAGDGGGPHDAAAGLRPMGAGDVLDGTVRTLVGSWRVVLGAVAAVSIPVQLLFVVVAPEMATTGPVQAFSEGFASPQPFDGQSDPALEFASMWRAQAFGLAQLAIVSPFVAGTVVYIVGRGRLGRPPGVGGALRAAAGRLHVLVAVRLLLGLLGLAATVAVGMAAAALVVGLGPVGIVLVFGLVLAAAAAGVGVVTLFAAVTPAVMLERLGPLAALRRSASLVRRRYWPTLGKVALVTLLVAIVSQALSLVAIPAELLAGGVAYVAVATLVGIVTTPLLPIALALIYLDLRVRTEGLDLHAALDQRPQPGAARG